MGLFGALLTLPLAPVRGVIWVAEQVAGEAERQRDDPAVIHAALVELELAHDDGLIDDQQRLDRENELMDRLIAARGGGAGPLGGGMDG